MSTTKRQTVGRVREICSGAADVPLETIHQVRRQMEERGYELPPLELQPQIPAGKRVFRFGDLFAEELNRRWEASFLSRLPGMKTGCRSCKDLQQQMNKAGVNRLNKGQVIDQVVKNLANINMLVPAAIAERMVDVKWVRDEISAVWNAAEARIPKKKRQYLKKRQKPRGHAFLQRSGARFITSAQMQEDIKLLCSKIPPDTTAIAGVARSGLSVATMVSMYLHLPMVTIRQNLHDVVQTGNGWRLGDQKHVVPKAEKVVIVDDTVMTGNSLRHLTPMVKAQFAADVVTAAVYVNPLATTKPDIHAVDLGWPHLLEWNLFNSVLSPNMACDFDGILCYDCHPGQDDDGRAYIDFIRNAKPLYLPRKTEIPLIVTARIEKYREDTLLWLSRHGVKVKKLVMHPARTLAERRRDDITAFKARVFDKWAQKHRPVPPPLAFIESDDWQAKLISQKSAGKMVICPGSAKVYGGKNAGDRPDKVGRKRKRTKPCGKCGAK